MAKEIKTFGSKGQKADEILNRIKTPTDQAVSGGVDSILNDFVRDTNAQMLGAFFGTMVTGTKMNKGSFDNMMATIAQKNVFNKINEVLDNLYTQTSGDEHTLFGHVVKISDTIKLISDGLLSYFAVPPVAGSQQGSMTYNITLDTSKAEDFDKILKSIAELAPENVKNVEKLFDSAAKISYIDMSSLHKNFIEPLNALTDLKYADIIKITEELVLSDMFMNLQDVFSSLSGISFSNDNIETAFTALDTFTASLIKYNELDINGLKILPEKLDLVMSILNADYGNKANLTDLFKKINDIGEVDPAVYSAIQGLAIATAHLLLFSEGLDKEAEKDITKSIESFNTIIDSLKTKVVLSEDDKEAIKASINALKECIVELSNVTQDIQQSGEDIAKIFGDYNNNIDLALKSSQSANAKMVQLVDTYKATNEKIKESSEVIEGVNYKDFSVSLTDLGSVILLMGLTMMLGGYLISKNPELIIGSFKFALTLAAFITVLMVPIFLINTLYSKLDVTQHSLGEVTRLVSGMAFVMIIGGMVYKWLGNDLSKNAMLFAIDMAKFLTLMLIPIALVGLISKRNVLQDMDAVGGFVVKSALVMIIGALIVQRKDIIDAALDFGIVLGSFIFLTLLPVIVFGAIVENNGIKYIKDIGRFVITCTLVMMLGALFMGNEKLWKRALQFGVLMAAFIGTILLPIALFSAFVEDPRTMQFLQDITSMIISFSLILMVGGLFMTWGNGKYAVGATKFALLMFAFTASLVLTIAVISRIVNEKALLAIRQFTKMVTMFATLLIVGALFMMLPGFAVAAISFAGLMLVFTALMGVVMVILSKTLRKDTLAMVGQFGLMVVLLSFALIVGGLTVHMIGLAPILMFAAMVGVMIGMIVLYVKLTSKINPAQMLKSMGVIVLFSISMLILSVAVAAAKKAIAGFEWKDIGKLLLVVGGLVAVFALIGIPYVAALVALGSTVVAAMGVALTIFSGALWVVHNIVKGFDGQDIYEEILTLCGVVGILGVLFSLIGPLSVLIIPASIAIAAMSVSITLFAGAMQLIHIMCKNSDKYLEDLSQTMIILGILGVVYSVIGALALPIAFGSVAILGISASMLAFSGALELIHNMVSYNASIIGEILTIIACASMLGVFYGLVGVISPLVIAASVAMAALSISLTMFSGALWIVNELIGDNSKETLKNLAVMSACIVSFGVVYGLIGALALPIALGSVALSALSVSLGLFGGVLALINVMIDSNLDVLAKIGTLSLCLIGLSGVFTLLGTLSPLIAIGSAVLTMLSGALLLFDAAIAGIVGVMKMVQTIDSTQTDKFATTLTGFFDAVDKGLPGPGKVLKLIAKAAGVTTLILPLSTMMGALANAIKDFASLRIPVEWDEKTGKATKYRQIKQNDFKDVITNVSDIVDTFMTALEGIYKKHSKTIDEATNSSMFSLLFGKPKSSLLRTIKVANMLGMCIGTLAENIANIAQLMIPDDWNQEGKAIHFRPMKEKDFEEASKGISKIISTVGEALIKFGDDHSDWVKDFQDNDRKGWFGKNEGNSKFGSVLRMSIGLSDMISKIAQAINDYSQLKVPVGFDENGNPTGYRKLKNKDFVDSGDNIKTIMEHFGKAITEGYENGFNKALKKTDRLETMFNNIINATSVVVQVAETIQKMSALKFEKADGTFTQLDHKVIYKAAENIEDVMMAIPDAIVRAYNYLENESDNKNVVENMSKFVNKLKPMGEFISEIVKAIQNYADLKIPTKYNNDGKAIEYRPLNLDESLSQMSTNLKNIMCGMGNAVADAYNTFEMDDKSPQVVAKAINAMKPIGEIFTNLMNTVQAYADFKIPQYGRDKNGEIKIIGYKTFDNNKELDKYFESMENNLVTILTGMVKCISSPKVTAILDEIINKDYSEYYESINTINDVISKVLETIQKYSELKIPKGDLDKDGKSTKGYYTLDTIPDTWYANLSMNLSDLIWSLPYSIKLAFDYFNQKNDDVKIIDQIQEAKKVIGDIMSSASSVMQSVFDIIQKYSELKIPKEFNKDGSVKSYIVMNSGNIEDMKKCIFDIVTAVPEAMKAVFNDLTENKISDNEIKFINGVINQDSYDIMVGASKLIEEYNKIKKDIQNVNIKNVIGKFISNIAEMYVDLAFVFKQSKASTDDIEQTYNYINAILSEESLQSINMICNNVDTLVTLVNKLKSSVIDKALVDIIAIKSTLTTEMVGNISAAKENIINTIISLVTSLKEIDNTLDDNKKPVKIDKKINDLDDISNIYKQLNIHIDNIMSNINSVNDLMFSNYKDFNTEDFEKIFTSVIDSLMAVNNIISTKYDEKNLQNINKFDKIIHSFDLYKNSLINVKNIFDDVKDLFSDYDDNVYNNVITQIESAISAVLRISKLIESPETVLETVDNLSNNIEKVTKKENLNVTKLVSDFALMAYKLEKGISVISESIDTIDKLGNPSIEPIENVLKVITEHAEKLDEKNIKKFDKESSALEKFTKSIEKTNTSKINSLVKLFDSMEKWSKSIGNLDEFTKALSDELAGTLEKLTSEITDAKQVIKTADKQRAERQKQLEQTIGKIEKLMNQTLHVNVSQEKGNTISSAWEKPND